MIAVYPDAIIVPVTTHYSDGSLWGRVWPKTVNLVVFHHTDGNWQSAINEWKTVRRASAHFIVRRDGLVVQCVDLTDIAWHASSWSHNLRSVGIEFEHYKLSDGKYTEWTALQLQRGAELVHWLALQMPSVEYLRHRDIVATICPDTLPVEKIIAMSETSNVFPQTGHAIDPRFLALWSAHGLFVFGYPITDSFIENGLTVQYFERARFELHGDIVMLGLVGKELLSLRPIG